MAFYQIKNITPHFFCPFQVFVVTKKKNQTLSWTGANQLLGTGTFSLIRIPHQIKHMKGS